MPESNLPTIRLLCLDVDGVLTDGTICIDDHGVETKAFHVRDGAGLRMWQSLGHQVAIITGRSSMAVQHRANELGIRMIVQKCRDKRAAFEQITRELRIEPAQAAMIGDDLPDLPLMRACGYPIAVADAAREVREMADFVTARPGGKGAVREAVEHLLIARGQHEEAMALWS